MNNYEKMREAFKKIDDEMSFCDRNVELGIGFALEGLREHCRIVREILKSALALPPRQCDEGTPYEQANRMRQFCDKQKRNGIINCGYCPIKHQYQRDCTLAWAQTPYEEGGAR